MRLLPPQICLDERCQDGTQKKCAAKRAVGDEVAVCVVQSAIEDGEENTKHLESLENSQGKDL